MYRRHQPLSSLQPGTTFTINHLFHLAFLCNLDIPFCCDADVEGDVRAGKHLGIQGRVEQVSVLQHKA